MPAAVVRSRSGAANAPASATTTVTFDAAAAAGNLLVLVVASDDYASSPPSGWTESAGCRQQTFLGHYLWWKVAAGGETSVNYTIGSASPSCWLVVEISGLTATPLDKSAGTFTASSAASYTTPAITPTSGDRFLLASIGGSRGNTLSGVDTWLNSFVEIVDAFTTLAGGTRDTAGIARNAVTADGVTSYSTGASYGGVAPEARTGMILAFKVAASGGATVAGAAALSGGSALTASATVATPTADVAGAAALAGQSAQTVSAKVQTAGTSALTGASTLTSSAHVEARVSGALTAGSTLASTASTSTPNAPQVFGAASMSSSSAATAAGAVDVRGVVGLSGSAALTSAASVDVHATSAMSAAGLLAPSAHLSHYVAVSMSAQSGLTARALSGASVQITPPLSVSLRETRTSAELADTRTKVTT